MAEKIYRPNVPHFQVKAFRHKVKNVENYIAYGILPPSTTMVKDTIDAPWYGAT